MSHTIYAAFSDPDHAERAAGALLDHGMRPEDLTVLRSHYGDNYEATHTTTGHGTTGSGIADRTDSTQIVGGTAGVVDTDPTPGVDYRNAVQADAAQVERSNPSPTDYERPVTYERVEVTETSTDHPDVVDDAGDTEAAAKYGISITTPADAGAGAIKGTAWGVGVGAVAALASMIIPGVGLVLGGGALAAGLGAVAASAGAGAAAGAVLGYLKDQGVDDETASHYHATVEDGGALLALHLDSGAMDEAKARDILEKYGATGINSYPSSRTGSA